MAPCIAQAPPAACVPTDTNATLRATLGGVADDKQSADDLSIRLRTDLRPQTWSATVSELRDRLCLPEIDDRALAGLKFSAALPRHLAVATLATRLADLDHAASVLAEPSRYAIEPFAVSGP